MVVLLSAAVYWPQLGAELDIRQDDHRIVFSGSTSPLHDQVLDHCRRTRSACPPDVPAAVRDDIFEGGRFRPLTIALEILLPKALGTESLHWHEAWICLLALASALIFLAAAGVFGSLPVAAMVAVMIMLGPDPGPAKTWYMMSTKAEAIGMVLLAVSVIYSTLAAERVGRWRLDAMALAAAAGAALAKESFVLVLPALAALRLWLQSRHTGSGLVASLRSAAPVLVMYAALFGAFLVAIAVTLHVAPAQSYGGATFTGAHRFADGLWLTMSHMPGQAVWFIPALLGAVAAWRFHGRNSAWTAVVVAAIALLWVAPQVVLYAARGGMWDHYWLPSIAGLAGLNGAALVFLNSIQSRGPAWAAVAAVALWSVNAARVNVVAVDNFAARTHARQEALHRVVDVTAADGKVLVVADARQFSEYALSWIFFLGDAGRPHSRIYLYDTGTPAAAFATGPFFPFGERLSDQPGCAFDSIIFISEPSLGDPEWAEWRLAPCYEDRSVSRPQRYWSVRKIGWVEETFQVHIAARAKSR